MQVLALLLLVQVKQSAWQEVNPKVVQELGGKILAAKAFSILQTVHFVASLFVEHFKQSE